MKGIYGPKRKSVGKDYNPAKRFMRFIQLLTTVDSISKADILEKIDIHDSAFYNYLASARELFPVTYEGSIGGNAYYSIDKGKLAEYFNL